MKTGFEIIDFHSHPFFTDEENISYNKRNMPMPHSIIKEDMEKVGISKICGAFIREKKDGETDWDAIKANNDMALEFREIYGDFYVPGFHVHPDYIKESCEEIERMHKLGVNLIGELVPYRHGWDDYSLKSFYEILDVAKSYNMIVNFHPMNDDNVDKMIKENPDVMFVGAHPGAYQGFITFERHLERMRMSENYYLDVSGGGITTHGMLKFGVNKFGAERFLFGTDYPVCNPGAYVGAILFDVTLTDSEKEMIFSKNAKRILGLK